MVTYEDWVVDGRIVLIDTDDDGVEEEVYEETVRKSTTLTFVAEGDGYDVVNIQTNTSSDIPRFQKYCLRWKLIMTVPKARGGVQKRFIGQRRHL